MNRERQLIEALQSCINCVLPLDTQFVIIDNASSDNTEFAVLDFFKKNQFDYYYEKLSENIGAGRGRNYAYLKSKGEYVYFLDDDAYIDSACRDFFLQAIKILESDKRIATLTTQIYDLLWKKNRITNPGPLIYEGINYCYMTCGGSHFLSRACFQNAEPYFLIKYGYEELKPTLFAVDLGYINAYVESLHVIHNPLVNKWDYSNIHNHELLIKGLVIPYYIKKNYYPKLVFPLVYFAYKLRCYKYLTTEQIHKTNEMLHEISITHKIGSRIKLKAVLRMFKLFGFSIF